MRFKLILLAVLIPILSKAQTTMTFNAPNPGVNSLDSIRYTYIGKAGGFSWLYNAQKIRSYVNSHAIDTSQLIHNKTYPDYETKNISLLGSVITSGGGAALGAVGSTQIAALSPSALIFTSKLGPQTLNISPSDANVLISSVTSGGINFIGGKVTVDAHATNPDDIITLKDIGGDIPSSGFSIKDSTLSKNKNIYDLPDKAIGRANLGVPYAKTSFLNYNANTVFLGNSLFYGVEGSISVPLKYAYYSGLGVSKQAYSGQTSTTIANAWIADTSNYRKPTVIWIGRNDFTDTTTVQNNITRIVTAMATVSNTKYLILTEINSTAPLEWTGTTRNILLTKLNASYSRLWPGHVLDIFTYLFNAYNPGIPQDVTDHGHGVISTSLRILNDTLHLNTNTGELIAKQALLNNSVLLPTIPSVLTNINYQNSLINRGHGYDPNGIMISDANGIQVQDQNLTWNPSTSVMNLGNSYGLINTVFGNGLLQLGSTSSGKNGSLQIVNSGNATNWELTPISGTTGLKMSHNSGALSTFNITGNTVGAKLGVNVSNATGILHTASLSGANASLFESPSGQDINVTFQNAGSVTKSGWQYRTATLETRFINYVNGPMTFFTNSTLGMTLSGTQVLSLVNAPILPLTGILKGNGTSATSVATANTDYLPVASPVMTTPTLGVATATSINKVAITAPATSATLTIANGKTLTANNSVTLAGTDATTMTFPATSATIARTDAANTFTGTQSFSSNPVFNTTSVVGQVWTATNTAGAGNWATSGIVNRAHTIFTPTTGGTVVLVNNQYNIINPAGTLLALTVTLPSSPANNDIVQIKFTQSITTVTYNGGTVVDGVTSPVGGGYVILTYDSGTTSWY